MYTLSTIQTAFIDLIGWRQNVDPNGVQLNGLTTSTSGIYMNEVHPLLTIANLESICPDFVSMGFTSDNYNSKFTEWLTQRMHGAIAQFLTDWIGRKFKMQSARNLLEWEKLYYTTGSNNKTIPNPGGKMAGIEIAVVRSRGVLGKIRKVSLHLTDAQSLSVFLYRSGDKNPIKSTTLNYVNAGDVQWFDVDWDLKGEGAYYLCYSLDELTGNAYDDSYDKTAYISDTKMPVGKYFVSQGFTGDIVSSGGVGSDEIGNTLIVGGGNVFVTSRLSYTSQSQGLNLSMTVACDMTEFIVEQKQAFASAYSLFLAKMLLREMAYNSGARTNRNQDNLRREEILYEIDGNSQGIAGTFQIGIGKRYEDALLAIQFDQTGIDKHCLPCAVARGIEYGVI